MDEPQAEKYIQQIPMWGMPLWGMPVWGRKKNSLGDIRAYLGRLHDPDGSMRIIHVAGTNGKGSVCAMLASILKAAGFQVGVFTSPHLVEVRERIGLNGQMVDSQSFEKAFQQVKALAQEMEQGGYCHPSYFEFLFYMAMVVFKEKKPDFVILETGLGGRLDVTNVIPNPILSVITSISLDHMEYLGNTIPQIAGEKAGIIKPGIPVVYDGSCQEAAQVISAYAAKAGAEAYPVSQEDWRILEKGPDHIQVEVSLDKDRKSWLALSIPSAAWYQAINAAVAVRAIEAAALAGWPKVKIPLEAVKAGISRLAWPARMEQVLPGVYLDGAHNVGGIRAFAQTGAYLCQAGGKGAWILFGAVSGKEYGEMISILCQELSPKGAILVQVRSDRSLGLGDMSREFKAAGCPVKTFARAGDALRYGLSIKEANDLLFCVGSLYLAGELKAELGKEDEHD